MKKLAKKQTGGVSDADNTGKYSKTNVFGVKKSISQDKAFKKASRYAGKSKSTVEFPKEGSAIIKPKPGAKRSITFEDYKKTGGATKAKKK
jgi:hypothetical protein